MTISVGDSLPDARLLQPGPEGPQVVQIADRLKGRKVVIFGLVGAFTGTCSEAHVPSFIRTKDKFDAAGVDEIICVTVNDPHVVKAWEAATGARDAGITTLADVQSEFTKAIGMDWSVPAVGFFNRSQRYALLAEDGIVKVLNVQDKPGECDISGGEALLESM